MQILLLYGTREGTHHDYKLTDWEDVARFAERFAVTEAMSRA